MQLAATSSKQMFDPDRQVAEPKACCMKYGIGDGGGHAGQRYLAQALCAGAVELEIGLVDEFHVDRTDVRIHGQHVFGEIGVQKSAVTGINFARFAQSGPDPPHDAAPHLARRGARADDPSAISDADDARDPDAPRAGFDAYLHEMRDVAESDEVGEDGPADTGESCCQPLIDRFWLPGCFPADLHFERWPSDGFKNLSRRLIGRSSGRKLVEYL